MAISKTTRIAMGAGVLALLIASGAAIVAIGNPEPANTTANNAAGAPAESGPAPSDAMGVKAAEHGNYTLKEHVWLHREVDMGGPNGTKQARVTYADLYEAETGAFVGVKRDVSMGGRGSRVVDIEIPRQNGTGLRA